MPAMDPLYWLVQRPICSQPLEGVCAPLSKAPAQLKLTAHLCSQTTRPEFMGGGGQNESEPATSGPNHTPCAEGSKPWVKLSA